MSELDRLAPPVVALAELALAFGRVDRITYHEDGVTPESDTDHTVMLGLVACAFAARYLPELRVGLVAQMALVHDLVEVYAGDTPALRATPSQLVDQTVRESAALARLREEFADTLPWVPDMIDRYEAQAEPEARCVRVLDKLLPNIVHMLNGGATFRTMGVGKAKLDGWYDRQLIELATYAAEFPELFTLRDELIELVRQRCFGGG